MGWRNKLSASDIFHRKSGAYPNEKSMIYVWLLNNGFCGLLAFCMIFFDVLGDFSVIFAAAVLIGNTLFDFVRTAAWYVSLLESDVDNGKIKSPPNVPASST